MDGTQQAAGCCHLLMERCTNNYAYDKGKKQRDMEEALCREDGGWRPRSGDRGFGIRMGRLWATYTDIAQDSALTAGEYLEDIAYFLPFCIFRNKWLERGTPLEKIPDSLSHPTLYALSMI